MANCSHCKHTVPRAQGFLKIYGQANPSQIQDGQCNFNHNRQHCTSGNSPPIFMNHELIAGKGVEDPCYMVKLSG